MAVSFFADGASGNYSANLVVGNHNATNFVGQSRTYALTAEVIDPIPVDAVLVLDRSGSMADPIGARSKSEASLAGARLFVQLLRDTADDRAAVIRFNDNPEVVQGILAIQGNRPTFETAIAFSGLFVSRHKGPRIPSRPQIGAISP